MKNKILCVCHTPLQLLNMMNLLQSEYSGRQYDLIISNRIKNIEILKNNITKSCFFSNVHVFYDTYKEDVQRYRNGIIKFIAYLLYCHKIKHEFHLKKEYEAYIFGNWDFISVQCFFWAGKPRLIWSDEGTSSYSYFLDYVFRKSLSDYIHRIPSFNRNISIQYLYRPELAISPVPFERRSLPFLTPDTKLANIASLLFGFSEEEKIHEKYIYFDGPYSEDDMQCNDRELLEIIKNIVGIDNLLVKVHPRNSAKWYIDNGYHINTNTSIPWEVYCMHPRLIDGKIIISIFSTALLSSWLYFNNPVKCISLMKFFDSKELEKRYKKLLIFVKDIFEKYPDIFQLPENKSELELLLK